MREQIKCCPDLFAQQPFIEALNQVLGFHVMKPGIALAFQELLIKYKRQANNQNNTNRYKCKDIKKKGL